MRGCVRVLLQVQSPLLPSWCPAQSVAAASPVRILEKDKREMGWDQRSQQQRAKVAGESQASNRTLVC